MQYKLIAMDLDGTLLDDNRAIPENNRKALRELREQKKKVVFCSGRSLVSINHLIKSLSLEGMVDYVVAFNGGLIYETVGSRVLYECLINAALTNAILREAILFDIEAFVHAKGVLYGQSESESLKMYYGRNKVPYIIFPHIEQLHIEASKVFFIDDAIKLMRYEEHAKSIFGDSCNICFTERTFLEFTDLKADKGNALAFLSDYTGIPLEQVIAIGDHHNDIPMLEKAGLGIAVRNATDIAKSVATLITRSNNNDGVLKEVLEYVLTTSSST